MAHALPGKLGTYIPATFGVTVFFFLSGYLITTLLRQESQLKGTIELKSFYLRRSLRILPPMYVGYAATFLCGCLGLLEQKGNLAGFFSSMGYYYNYSQLLTRHAEVPTGMTVLWSLSIEEHFYLIFPVLYMFMVRSRMRVTCQSGLLLTLCLLGLIWRVVLFIAIRPPTLGHLSWTYAATDARFDSILWGCLLAIRANPLFNDRVGLLARKSGGFALSGFALIFLSMSFRQPLYREAFRYTLQALGLFPVFYYCIAYSSQWQVQWLECPPLRWIGWLSYSLYLIHNAFLLSLHLRYPNYLVADGTAALAASLVYAWMVRRLVESPIQLMKGQLSTTRFIVRNDKEIAA